MNAVRWSGIADAQLRTYSDWIWGEASPVHAAAFIRALLSWTGQLADFPRIGTPRDDLMPSVRTRTFRKAVTIAYTVDERGEVTILRLLARGRDITAADFADPE